MKPRSAIKTDLFADEHHRKKIDALGDPLAEIESHIDFASLAAEVDKVAPRPVSAQGGRPPYPTETMVRILVLKRLYNLSDEALEFQVLDRRSFLRFAGLERSGKVPDARTFWVWRERLKQGDLMGDISAAVSGQLQRAGFIARGGQIIDASFVTAPIQRNTREENAQLKQGQVPSHWSDAKRAHKDVDARWARKHGKNHFGYKLHANTDRRWGFIRKAQVTPANVHDSAMFERVLDPANTARQVYADRGYGKRDREHALKAQGYRPRIQRQGQAHRPLSAADQRRNRSIARDRAFGEHPFARLRQMGGKCLRTIGLARAQVQVGLKVAAHNLQHLARLLERGAVPA